MIRPKTVSAHWAKSSISAIVEVRHACAHMGRFIHTCNMCRRATWAESSVLMLGNIFDLYIIYNFLLYHYSGNCVIYFNLHAYSFRTLCKIRYYLKFGEFFIISLSILRDLYDLIRLAYYLRCVSFHCGPKHPGPNHPSRWAETVLGRIIRDPYYYY